MTQPPQSREKIECLFELATLLSHQVDFGEIVRIIIRRTSELLEADSAVIQMVNPNTQDTVKTIHREEKQQGYSLPQRVQHQVSGWILYHNKSLISPEIKKDARFSNVYLEDVENVSAIGVPLNIEGSTIGSLLLLRYDEKAKFNEDDIDFLQQIALIATPYLRNAEKLYHFFHSPLPNEALINKYKQYGLIGKCERFIELLKATETAAHSDVRVLLEGATGTGKELIAKRFTKTAVGPMDHLSLSIVALFNIT